MATEFLKYIGINNHVIELVDNRQPLYGPIYSPSLLELQILKAYIENNLANGFISPSKFPAEVPIFSNKKFDKSLTLCVDNQSLNNLTTKN